MTPNRYCLFLVPLLAAGPINSGAAAADDPPRASRLVNLEGTAIAPKGTVAGSLDIRFFDHPEDIVYTSATLRYGLFDHLELGVRGVTGATKGLAVPAGGTIFHGGRDLELFGKYGFNLDRRTDLAGLIGVSFPSTPAQSRAIFTAGGMGSFRFDDRITLFLNPRGTAQDGNATVGIGVGTEVRVHPGLSIVGDWTGMIDGENTRSTSTGARIKGDVWGVALRWSSTDRWVHYAADFGYNTGTGSTTGFSLTPGLGNSGGFYFALSAHH